MHFKRNDSAALRRVCVPALETEFNHRNGGNSFQSLLPPSMRRCWQTTDLFSGRFWSKRPVGTTDLLRLPSTPGSAMARLFNQSQSSLGSCIIRNGAEGKGEQRISKMRLQKERVSKMSLLHDMKLKMGDGQCLDLLFAEGIRQG